MKLTILALLALTTFSRAQSLEVMERGAKAICLPDQNHLTSQQAEDELMFYSTWKGFALGINCSSMLVQNGSRSLTDVPNWMLDPTKAAPSFLAFVSAHRPKGFATSHNVEARISGLLLAWYFDQSPESGQYQKVMIDLLVKDYFYSKAELDAIENARQEKSDKEDKASAESLKAQAKYLDYLRDLRKSQEPVIMGEKKGK